MDFPRKWENWGLRLVGVTPEPFLYPNLDQTFADGASKRDHPKEPSLV